MIQAGVTSSCGGVLHGSIAGTDLTEGGSLVTWSGVASGVTGFASPLAVAMFWHTRVGGVVGLGAVTLLSAPRPWHVF